MNRIALATIVATFAITCCEAAPHAAKSAAERHSARPASTQRAVAAPVAPADPTSLDVPSNYRALVAARLRSDVRNPSSIHEAGISAPAQRKAGFFRGSRPSVCVRYSASNRWGRDRGPKSALYYFKGGQVDGVARRGALCRDATYVAFAEVESNRVVEPIRAEPPRSRSAPPPARVQSSDASAGRTYYDDRRGSTWYRQRS